MSTARCVALALAVAVAVAVAVALALALILTLTLTLTSHHGQAPEGCDVDQLLATLATMDVAGAVAHFEKQLGALAVPCNTVKEIAALCSDDGSKTAP